jgi:hypothetical protein
VVSVLALLDALFLYGFIGLLTTAALILLRLYSFVIGTDPSSLIRVGGFTFASAVLAWLVVTLWMLADVVGSKGTVSESGVSMWAHVFKANPIIVGPTAYYIGLYRPTRGGNSAGLIRRMASDRAILDALVLISSGSLLVLLVIAISFLVIVPFADNALVLTALMSATAVSIPVGGLSATVLAVVLLVDAVDKQDKDPDRLAALVGIRVVPWWSWVLGLRRYYHSEVRPQILGTSQG